MLRQQYTILMKLGLALSLCACSPPSRMGMVTAADGYQYGSIVERNLVIDASQFANRNLKLTLRNISGDLAYDLSGFRGDLESALLEKGYNPIQGDEFGMRLDVNVLYSGHVQSNLGSEYAFLGGTIGGLAGYNKDHGEGAAIGAISGATLGGILGSYVTDNTYIVIAEITLAIADPNRGINKKIITFSSSPPLEQKRESGVKPFQQTLSTKVAIYAGGRNAKQTDIANGVQARLAHIVANII